MQLSEYEFIAKIAYNNSNDTATQYCHLHKSYFGGSGGGDGESSLTSVVVKIKINAPYNHCPIAMYIDD